MTLVLLEVELLGNYVCRQESQLGDLCRRNHCANRASILDVFPVYGVVRSEIDTECKRIDDRGLHAGTKVCPRSTVYIRLSRQPGPAVVPICVVRLEHGQGRIVAVVLDLVQIKQAANRLCA